MTRKLAIIMPSAIISLSVCACTTSVDTFQVEDERKLIRSAKIELCGSETMMDRRGNHFWATHEITCDGSGLIRLTYNDDSARGCKVGYVTNLQQRHNFRALPDRCEAIAS